MRGAFQTASLRAVVNVADHDSGTSLDVKIFRSPIAAWFMTILGGFAVIWPVLEVIALAATRGVSAVWGSAPLLFVVVGPLLFALVMAINYSSTRTQAKELKTLIATIVS
jgi:hypothetical protein